MAEMGFLSRSSDDDAILDYVEVPAATLLGVAAARLHPVQAPPRLALELQDDAQLPATVDNTNSLSEARASGAGATPASSKRTAACSRVRGAPRSSNATRSRP